MPFHLSKWYLDCVSACGRVFIGYAASLRWNGLRVLYNSALRHDADGETTVQSTCRATAEPATGPNEIRWSPGGLACEGVWEGSRSPLAEIVHRDERGAVEWTCLYDGCEARVSLPGGVTLTGRGYAEHLTMTIPPWTLPITSLRWGHFSGRGRAVVWIDWAGGESKRFVFVNGVRTKAETIEDDRLLLSDGAELRLDCERTLRCGALGATVLQSIPILKRFAPARILNTHEHKWRSRAIWVTSGGDREQGWAIHEAVKWP